MGNHTPGPWAVQRLEESHNGYTGWKTFTIRSKQNVCLSVVGEVDHYHEQDHEANALLIAAAPDLLDALRACVFSLRSPDALNENSVKMAEKAIAKAEGR